MMSFMIQTGNESSGEGTQLNALTRALYFTAMYMYVNIMMVFVILGVEIEKNLLKIWECLAQEKTIEMQSILITCFHFI